jgi:hypothetical protein
LIQEINKRRHDFYTRCSALIRTDLKQPHNDFDWLPMLTYLNDGPDLLEKAVKEANYPIPFQFRPVSKGLEPVGEQQGKNAFFLFLSF